MSTELYIYINYNYKSIYLFYTIIVKMHFLLNHTFILIRKWLRPVVDTDVEIKTSITEVFDIYTSLLRSSPPHIRVVNPVPCSMTLAYCSQLYDAPLFCLDHMLKSMRVSTICLPTKIFHFIFN